MTTAAPVLPTMPTILAAVHAVFLAVVAAVRSVFLAVLASILPIVILAAHGQADHAEDHHQTKHYGSF
jgi:hypothetical protein